jgi:hypothetical protein
LDKVTIGVPCYGAQDSLWWSQLVNNVAFLHKQEIDYQGLIVSSTMATDHNRNQIVKDFLKTDADWLFWIDADTIPPMGTIRRLLDTKKEMVSGLYYGKGQDNPPIAYIRVEDGTYLPLHKARKWERGEIIAVDATGMGCMLTHRSIFEKMAAEYKSMQRVGGGLTLVHKDDFERGSGDLAKNKKTHGKVIRGQLRETLTYKDDGIFPYFAIEFGRTEDIWFFERLQRIGLKVWLDTSVECGHLKSVPVTGKTFRERHGA